MLSRQCLLTKGVAIMPERTAFHAPLSYYQRLADLTSRLACIFTNYFDSRSIIGKSFQYRAWHLNDQIRRARKSKQLPQLFCHLRLVDCLAEMRRIKFQYFSEQSLIKLYQDLQLTEEETERKSLYRKLETIQTIERIFYEFTLLFKYTQTQQPRPRDIPSKEVCYEKFSLFEHDLRLCLDINHRATRYAISYPARNRDYHYNHYIKKLFQDEVDVFPIKMQDEVDVFPIKMQSAKNQKKSAQQQVLQTLTSAVQQERFQAVDNFLFRPKEIGKSVSMQNIITAITVNQHWLPDIYFDQTTDVSGQETKRFFQILQFARQTEGNQRELYQLFTQHRPSLAKVVLRTPQEKMKLAILLDDTEIAANALKVKRSFACFRYTKKYRPTPDECIELITAFHTDKKFVKKLLDAVNNWKLFADHHVIALLELGLTDQGEHLRKEVKNNRKFRRTILERIHTIIQKRFLTEDEKYRLQKFLCCPNILSKITSRELTHIQALGIFEFEFLMQEQSKELRARLEHRQGKRFYVDALKSFINKRVEIEEELISNEDDYATTTEYSYIFEHKRFNRINIKTILASHAYLVFIKRNKELLSALEQQINELMCTTEFIEDEFIFQNLSLWTSLRLTFAFSNFRVQDKMRTVTNIKFDYGKTVEEKTKAKTEIQTILSNSALLTYYLSINPQNERILSVSIVHLFETQLLDESFFNENREMWQTIGLHLNEEKIKNHLSLTVVCPVNMDEYDLTKISSILSSREQLEAIVQNIPERQERIGELITKLYKQQKLSTAFLRANEKNWKYLGINLNTEALIDSHTLDAIDSELVFMDKSQDVDVLTGLIHNEQRLKEIFAISPSHRKQIHDAIIQLRLQRRLSISEWDRLNWKGLEIPSIPSDEVFEYATPFYASEIKEEDMDNIFKTLKDEYLLVRLINAFPDITPRIKKAVEALTEQEIISTDDRRNYHHIWEKQGINIDSKKLSIAMSPKIPISSTTHFKPISL